MTITGPVGIEDFVGTGPAVGGDPVDPYEILVKTDNAGTSASNQFTLPATGTYTVDWGDGVIESLSGSQTHTYPAAGLYFIKVTGGLSAITFNNGGDRLKLLEIRSWGSIAWQTMAFSYFGCANMHGRWKAAPNLSGATSTRSMFRDCSVFNWPMADWDVSTIQEMHSMFFGTSFNQDITGWDTSNVTTMNSMFRGTPFDQPIGVWDVGNVDNMNNMLWAPLDQDLGGWNLRLAGVNLSMFNAPSGMSVENYSRTLIGWANYVAANSNMPSGATLGNLSTKYNDTEYTSGQAYNDAVSARAYLTSPSPGWTITDGGPE